MYYYRIFIFVLRSGPWGISQGETIRVYAALYEPYQEDCTGDQKLVSAISKKSDKLKIKDFEKAHISECQKVSCYIFNKTKNKVFIEIEG